MKFFGSFLSVFLLFAGPSASAQQRLTRDFDLKVGASVVVTNFHGKVTVSAEEAQGDKASLSAESAKEIADKDLKISNKSGRLEITVSPADEKARIDLTLKIPLRSRVRVETREGEVRVAGNLESAEVTTETGTISTDVPLDSVKYNFLWTVSRPRYLSDVPLADEVKEKSGGRFALSGKLGEAALSKKEREKGKEGEGEKDEKDEKENPAAGAQPGAVENATTASADGENPDGDKEGKKKPTEKEKKLADKTVSLNFSTDRGIVLLNVNPAEVPSNLRERPLTEAAKAIVRSGDSLLLEAIRRSSPKHFGDYLKTLPPRKREPSLAERQRAEDTRPPGPRVRQAFVKVTDSNNRAIGGLEKKDFTVLESGQEREILKVEPTTAPFNLVLLLDVSGSIDTYVDFLRKTARNFINTMNPDDRIAIVIFNEDVKQISTFTTDRAVLSESLDTFDAGGGTAYYDALGYTLVETLRPMRGERTAVIVMSDGDDNRSFLPFESLLGSIQESGALVYPLYVPSDLVAASRSNNPNATIDPLRTRYMGLTSKAEAEGTRLAQVSGGVYYPIRRFDELQKAYDDIVVQLRTAYTVTYRSDARLETTPDNRASPRLKVKVARENAFVNISRVIDAPVAARARGFDPGRELSGVFGEEAGRRARTGDFAYRVVSFPPPPRRGLSAAENSPHLPEVTGEIGEVKYKPLLANTLQTVSFGSGFDINKSPPSFVLADGENRTAVSRWVSPKRTRSYPYERIYNTLLNPKKVTVIPVFKDEGAEGERDFLQFDTISLLNLLDVHLILGYYNQAQRASSGSLGDQQFDAAFVSEKLRELGAFRGSATEWNLKQLQEVSPLLEKAKTAYAEISRRTGVRLHDDKGVDHFARRVRQSLEEFRAFSRRKSQDAQAREFQTLQPKESLSSDTKARVTISDRSGGKYFFTCDETLVDGQTLYLIEAKHSARAKMPSAPDIKDGLLKMMLYSNLRGVRVGRRPVAARAALRLTSYRLEGAISSEADSQSVENFLQTNRFSANQKGFIQKLFREARENHFVVRLERGEAGK